MKFTSATSAAALLAGAAAAADKPSSPAPPRMPAYIDPVITIQPASSPYTEGSASSSFTPIKMSHAALQSKLGSMARDILQAPSGGLDALSGMLDANVVELSSASLSAISELTMADLSTSWETYEKPQASALFAEVAHLSSSSSGGAVARRDAAVYTILGELVYNATELRSRLAGYGMYAAAVYQVVAATEVALLRECVATPGCDHWHNVAETAAMHVQALDYFHQDFDSFVRENVRPRESLDLLAYRSWVEFRENAKGEWFTYYENPACFAGSTTTYDDCRAKNMALADEAVERYVAFSEDPDCMFRCGDETTDFGWLKCPNFCGGNWPGVHISREYLGDWFYESRDQYARM